MLSESHAGAKAGAGALLRRVAWSTTGRSRLWGTVMGGLLLIVVAGLMGVVSSGSVVILLLIPVSVLAWFGGVWAGRAGAVGAGAIQASLGGLWFPAAESTGLDGLGFVVTAGTLLVVAESMPGLREAARQHREQTQRDPLTGLGNRRYFRELAAVELHRTRRYRRPLSLIYLDVDGFERLNEKSGYAAGDQILSSIGTVLSASFRASDVVARIAGDEFAMLLPETSGEGAQVVAQKLRNRLGEAMTAAGHAVTLSVAIIGFEDGAVSLDPVLQQADAAMLEAKNAGPGGTRYRDYIHPPVSLV
ncbi:MAG: GGDEF domain-containing protein [Longimicrobiales bacterium]